MKKNIYSFFLLFLFGFLSVHYPLYGQTLDDQNYVVKHFTMDDGLPQNSINEILQSSDGYIWIATFSGLVRFDGHDFKVFNRVNTPCLISDEFLNIHISSDNSIWLFPSTLNTVITKFKDGICHNFKIADGISSSFAFLEDYDGTVWAINEGTPYRFNGKEFEEIIPSENTELTNIALQNEQGSWFGVGKNLYRIFNGVPVKAFDDLPVNENLFSRVFTHPDLEKTILVDAKNSIIEYEFHDQLVYKTTYSLDDPFFLDLKFDKKGNQFAKTASGIAQKIDNSFEFLKPFKDQPNIRLKSILQDNEGNYWIGTGGDGLFRFRKKIISMIDKNDGLRNEKILSITKLENGKMLISTNCSEVYEWDGERAKVSPLQELIKSNCFWSIFEDSKERIWFGAGGPHLMENYGEPAIEFGDDQDFDGYAIFATTEDKNGHIWVASARGIYIYDGTTLIRKITEEDGLYYNDSRVMFEDEDGTMWVGTNGGLHTVKNYEVAKVPLLKQEDNEFEKQPYIRAIHKDEDGIFWIGTYGDGLFRIENKEVFRFTTELGLFDNIASHIIEDASGFFWMGTNRGIQRVSRNHLNLVAEGEMERVISYSYGSADGMNSPETNGGFQPSYIVEENGDFYLPTVAGVAKVSVSKANINHIPPPVYIETVKNNFSEDLDKEDLKLDYDNAFLEINYTAINFSDPSKVQFKYRLLGLNDQWVDAGTRREAIYTKLPPGEYIFQVAATNNDGVWNDEGAVLAISVIPPYWKTT